MKSKPWHGVSYNWWENALVIDKAIFYFMKWNISNKQIGYLLTATQMETMLRAIHIAITAENNKIQPRKNVVNDS